MTRYRRCRPMRTSVRKKYHRKIRLPLKNVNYMSAGIQHFQVRTMMFKLEIHNCIPGRRVQSPWVRIIGGTLDVADAYFLMSLQIPPLFDSNKDFLISVSTRR